MKRLIWILLVPCFSLAACGEATEPDPTQPAATNNGVDVPAETGNNAVDRPAETTNNAVDRPAETTKNGQQNNSSGLALSTFHEEIFVAEGCTSGYCHGNFALNSPEAVVQAFVNVEAPEPTCGRTQYVVPGDPENSILWVRVRPITVEDQECGVSKMPANSETGLDEQTAQVIYDWIEDGAQL